MLIAIPFDTRKDAHSIRIRFDIEKCTGEVVSEFGGTRLQVVATGHLPRVTDGATTKVNQGTSNLERIQYLYVTREMEGSGGILFEECIRRRGWDGGVQQP